MRKPSPPRRAQLAKVPAAQWIERLESRCLLSSTGLQVTYGDDGLSTLTFNGVQLLNAVNRPEDGFWVSDYTRVSADGTVQPTSSPPTITMNQATHQLSYQYDWGRITTTYTQVGNTLNLKFLVTNTTASDTIKGVDLYPVTFSFPAMPAGFAGSPQVSFGNAPPVVTADYGSGEVAVVNPDLSRRMYSGLNALNTSAVDNRYELLVASAPVKSASTAWPALYLPIAPGASDTYNISLRFAPSGTPGTTLAADIYQAYAAAHPDQVVWPDRRPIDMLSPSQSGPEGRSATNPRGWFNDPTIDVTTPQGLAAFRTEMLASADSSIAVLKDMNAQGAIVWNIEGEQFPDATYVGDPRLVDRLAPELDYQNTVDDYFKKFTDAGLRIGVTIREEQVVFDANGVPTQTTSPDPAQTMIDKINYARQRWGATLFYIDSIPAEQDLSILKRVADAEPGVLLIPEHSDIGSYSVSAPYSEVQLGSLGTTAQTVDTYPGAFGVINVLYTNDLQAEVPALTAAVARGDILLSYGWWESPEAAVVKQIYQTADPLPPATLSATGVSAAQINLSWEAVTGAVSYRIERSADGTAGWSTIATLDASHTTYADPALPDGTAQYYRVSTLTTISTSAPSAAVSAATALIAPTDLAANAITTSANSAAVTLTWLDHSAVHPQYVLIRSADPSFTNVQIVPLSVDQTTYTDAAARPNTLYYYRLNAVNTAAGSSSFASSSVTTPAVLLPTVVLGIPSVEAVAPMPKAATTALALALRPQLTAVANFSPSIPLPPAGNQSILSSVLQTSMPPLDDNQAAQSSSDLSEL